MLCLLPLASCSISSPIKASSLELLETSLTPQDRYSLEEIDQDPYLYKVIDKNSLTSSPPPFITALKQCGGVGRTASTIATTRQLLIGLRNILIEKQTILVVSQRKVLFSILKASLDNRELTVLCFSSRDDECVTDLVAWNDSEYKDSLLDYLKTANQETLSQWITNFSIFNEQ